MKATNIALIATAMMFGSNAHAFATLKPLGKAEFTSTIEIVKECSMVVESDKSGIYIPTFNELADIDTARIRFTANSPSQIQIASSKVFTNSAPWGSPTIEPDITLHMIGEDETTTEIKGVRTDIDLIPSSSGQLYRVYPQVTKKPSHAGNGAIKTTLTVNCNVL